MMNWEDQDEHVHYQAMEPFMKRLWLLFGGNTRHPAYYELMERIYRMTIWDAEMFLNGLKAGIEIDISNKK